VCIFTSDYIQYIHVKHVGWGYKNSDKHGYDYNRDIQNIDLYLQV